MADELDLIIARRVRAALWECSNTNEEVAAAIGLSRRSLQRRLVGERSFMMTELMRMSKFLGSSARLIDRVCNVQ